jgi:hypothetical protein
LKITPSTSHFIVISSEIEFGNVYVPAFRIFTVSHSVAASIASATVKYQSSQILAS